MCLGHPMIHAHQAQRVLLGNMGCHLIHVQRSLPGFLVCQATHARRAAHTPRATCAITVHNATPVGHVFSGTHDDRVGHVSHGPHGGNTRAARRVVAPVGAADPRLRLVPRGQRDLRVAWDSRETHMSRESRVSREVVVAGWACD